MRPEHRARWVAGLLLLAWLLVLAWQVYEHSRVVAAAQLDVQHRARDIANNLSAVTQALEFRGNVAEDRLAKVLNNMVTNGTTRLVSVSLLNTNGDSVLSEGDTNLLSHETPLPTAADSGRWSDHYVTFLMTLEGPSLATNALVVLPSFRSFTNSSAYTNGEFPPPGPRRDQPDFMGDDRDHEHDHPHGPPPLITNADGQVFMQPPPNGGGGRPHGGGGRPWWMRGMSDSDFRALMAKHELHGLVLVMSTENYRITCQDDVWLRLVIVIFAGISAIVALMAWRNMAHTAELQIRLVRASESNSHLKEMNLAAAGLAHETRNPLNIIRGLAQMVSRLPDASPEVRNQTKTIVEETDKVTAQLTEFINYSRPREVRRTKVPLPAAAAEIIRTLNFDIEEKKLRVEAAGETVAIEADEQLLRQVLFNLLLNAIQAVGEGGNIRIEVQRATATEAFLEVRDDGPGVLPENRTEIFKPYFTTHQKGTGLGLAVVSQIVQAHGWEIQYVPNQPRGAIFRITHLKIAG